MRGIPEEGTFPYAARSRSAKEWYTAFASGTTTMTLPYDCSGSNPSGSQKCSVMSSSRTTA
jgi:hypothetical protein